MGLDAAVCTLPGESESGRRGSNPRPSAWEVLTTVGYGDEYPHTTLGRALGMSIMLIGIGFIAVLTGAVAQRFLSGQIERLQKPNERSKQPTLSSW